jgi:hypothetical protein
LSRKDALSGKQVVVKGRCIKVNSNIMGRNWVHLQDGSYDEYDLVVTTNSTMTVGDEVKVEATVALKKRLWLGLLLRSDLRRRARCGDFLKWQESSDDELFRQRICLHLKYFRLNLTVGIKCKYRI